MIQDVIIRKIEKGRARPSPDLTGDNGRRADRGVAQGRAGIGWRRAFGVTRAASSLPEAGLRQSREKRLSLGDLGHFGRRREAFERGGEDGVGVGGAAGAF
jgi:hypothetical protein